ncbi:4203_t:CDS:2, partial [Dentiscutata heterogama]
NMSFEFSNAKTIFISEDDKDTEKEDNEINILKFKLLVKGKDNKAFLAKIKKFEFLIAYKTRKESGLGIQIVDEVDFNYFIKEYNQAKANKKDIQ